MINLELLAWSTKVTGDSTYVKSAISHAMNTLTNHYRKDYSCYHLVDYDLATGEVRGKQTFQGYDDASSWARGQAWGLYGFTMMYNETKEDAFLVQAKHIANYIFNNTPRDASAAAVTASTLLELYRLTNNDSYLKFAEKILWNLSSPKYMNAANENNNFLLKHSTGHKPHNSEIDVPIIYADYYFVEALYRYVKLRNVGIALL